MTTTKTFEIDAFEIENYRQIAEAAAPEDLDALMDAIYCASQFAPKTNAGKYPNAWLRFAARIANAVGKSRLFFYTPDRDAIVFVVPVSDGIFAQLERLDLSAPNVAGIYRAYLNDVEGGNEDNAG